MEIASQKADRTVRDILITKNAALKDDERRAIEIFRGLANQATHKSKLHLGLNLLHVVNNRPVPLPPHFDLKRAGAAHNMLSMSSWSLMATLPYLAFAVPQSDTVWHQRYELVQSAFAEGPGKGPDPSMRAWGAVVDGIFARPQIFSA